VAQEPVRASVEDFEQIVESGRCDPHIELSELEMVRFLFGAGPDDAMFPTAVHRYLGSILPLDFYVWTLEQ
jgi:hypothetical protein